MKRLDFQFTLLLLVAFAALLVWHYQSQRKLLALAAAAGPLHLNQTFLSLYLAPSTTNIEKVEGTGHTIGNENSVQNDAA